MTKHSYASGALAFALAATTATAAFAQLSGATKTAIDPSKIEDRFTPPPAATPGTSAAALPEVPKSGGGTIKGAERRFTLRGVAITGSTVYNQEQLAPLFADYLGKEMSLGEAQGIAERVTIKYRNDGYILSQAVIPEQQLSNGVLKIRVVEGFIDKVVIQGDVRENSWRSLINGYGDKIRQRRPLHIATLERYLLLMDDLPGATAKGVVRPSQSTFGAADIVVTVTHKTFEGSLSTDNRGTKYIGPQQWTGTVAANSVLGLYERTTLRGITTNPTSELRFVDLQHEEQIGYEGTRLIVSGSYSRTEPSYTLTPLEIEGNSVSLQLKAQHPFIRSRSENFSLRGLFDYRNTDTDLLDSDFTDDRLRVLRAGAAYDFTDRFSGVSLVDAQLSKGINIFNASESGSDRSRTDGDSDFAKVNLDLSRTQTLPAGFSLLTAVTGQWSDDKLFSSEQFSVGGVGFGSAYDPAEISGDKGVAAKAELRYGHYVGWQYFNAFQLFGYYDIGTVWNVDTTTDNNSLASTGLGVRANFTPWLSGSAEMGVPLTKQVSVQNDHDPRFFFSLTGRF